MTKISFIIVPLVLAAFESKSQKSVCDPIFNVVDKMPEYKEGLHEFYNFLGKEVHFTERCRPEGKLIFSFVIDKEGEVRDIEIDGLSAGCEENLVNVLKQMPRWEPGTRGGKTVCVKISTVMNICYK
jgi:hypothetical protein